MTLPKTHPLYVAAQVLEKNWWDLPNGVEVIRALEAAGYKVVGPQPTDEMVEAGRYYTGKASLRLSIAAAPTITETEKGGWADTGGAGYAGRALRDRGQEGSVKPCIYCNCLTIPRDMPNKDKMRIAGLAKGDPCATLHVRFRRPTKEHLMRRADGGRSIPGNIAVACAWCNSNRGERSVLEHKLLMQELVRRKWHPCHNALMCDKRRRRQLSAFMAGR